MKKLLVFAGALMLSVSAMAQHSLDSQIAELKQKAEAQQQQLKAAMDREIAAMNEFAELYR